ncbi:TPA: prolipoprotein diacylglyceryl transferase [Candidatus Delongbacteria bacterium]|nr:MAG: prolipoprotein diacylglyceryl transferase [Candidatus Delongbacteria bacterium GWF2_40_14]HAQ62224.1 prolipoprotein diacylglyceryl transferase [Candidatus Delongbacteria bacterium]
MDSFVKWWQTLPYAIDPTIIHVGSFQVKYYGLMYIVAFSLTFYLLNRRLKNKEFELSREVLENYFFQVILFILIGGRLGYVLFYNLKYFISNPLEIFLPFRYDNGFEFTGIAGMSYHGAVISAFAGTYWFTKKNKLEFLKFIDFIAIAAPLGYTFGRIGNFINGELYGRVTDSSIGMYFPLAGDEMLRHPSQLYEALFEGIFIFIILWSLRNRKFRSGFFVSAYLVLYGTVRFIIEYFREPDDHLGFVLLNFSMGQVLCFIMIISGIVVYIIGYHSNKKGVT